MHVIKHLKTSTIPAGVNPAKVGGPDWNDDHSVDNPTALTAVLDVVTTGAKGLAPAGAAAGKLLTGTGWVPNAAVTLKVNAADYGAVLDGVHDDAPALNAALTALAAALPSGTYGGFVDVGFGVALCGSQIVLPNGCGLRGRGPSATIIRAKSTFSGTSLITNQNQDGTQEYAFLEALQVDGNQGAGAVCSIAVVDMVSLFINSWFRDLTVLGGSNVGFRIAAGGSPGGTGPILVSNVWTVHNIGHNFMIEEIAGNTGAGAGICVINLTSEHQGSNSSAVYLKGLGHFGQCNFWNTHIEQGGSETNRTGITIDGIAHCLFEGVELQCGTPANEAAGITITSAIQNVGIQIRGVTNINLINPVLNDVKNGITVGALNLPWYITPDIALPGVNVAPDTLGKALNVKDSSGTSRAWFDAAGQLTGTSFNGAGLDVIGDATNDRALTLTNHAKTRIFGWFFPDASNFRLRYFTGGTDLLNFDNSGNGFLYGATTLQGNVTMQSSATMLHAIIKSGELVVGAYGTTPQNNIAPTSFASAYDVFLSASIASVDVTGIAGGVNGRDIYVYNDGASNNIVLKHLSGSSTAGNQIVGWGNADVTLTPGTGVTLRYSASLTKWVVRSKV